MSRENLRDLRVVNAEGDDLEFCSATYEVTDEPGVHTFGWLESARIESRRSYGHIEIREGGLRIECNSRKRLAIGQQLLEKHAGTWLRHIADSFQTLEAVKAAAAELGL